MHNYKCNYGDFSYVLFFFLQDTYALKLPNMFSLTLQMITLVINNQSIIHLFNVSQTGK